MMAAALAVALSVWASRRHWRPHRKDRQMRIAPQSRPWREWYQLNVWRKRRRLHLRAFPMCVMCAARGVATPATIADHIRPHRADWNEFRLGALQSLCFDCHNKAKQRYDLDGYGLSIGDDGWPLDPRHPANSGKLDSQQRSARINRPSGPR